MFKSKKNKAFTLVELLVVMSIIGVLVAIAAGSFRSAQLRGRDAQRKSDLKEISHSLELFYADYGKYPDASSGHISACPYNPGTSSGTTCSWGTSSFTDSKTTYFKALPVDPGDYNYVYRIVPGSSNQKYQLYAYLENTQDIDLMSGLTQSCGSGKTCNFSVTSANANATE